MTSNVYSAEPAHPVLAQSLLSEPGPTATNEQPTRGSTTNDWNLIDDWTAGIQSSSDGIFRCGTIIGFSRLRTRSSDNDEYIGQVSNPPCVSRNYSASSNMNSDSSLSADNTLAEESTIS
jgi:hypothetical protein